MARARKRAESPAAGPEPSADLPLRFRWKIWLERGDRVALSEWRMELLRAVAETGSLTRGAERMGVPYRTAWYKLKDMEVSLGIPLLSTQSGGAEGGGSELTPAARDLLERFRRATAGLDETVEARLRAELGDLLG